MKRWLDPWPVFFKREFNRTWPFLVGFVITGTIITKFSLGLTGDSAKPIWLQSIVMRGLIVLLLSFPNEP